MREHTLEHEDIFFNLVDRLQRYGVINNTTSRTVISKLAGAYADALLDCSIEYRPEDIRTDYFNRV
jgi:hypothetical protein